MFPSPCTGIIDVSGVRLSDSPQQERGARSGVSTIAREKLMAAALISAAAIGLALAGSGYWTLWQSRNTAADNVLAPALVTFPERRPLAEFILVDDEKRENEGDLVISTSDSNAKNINFMAKYGRGLICLALDTLQAKRLNLSLMSPVNQSRNKTAFTISIEAKKGITTGISAKDRARTIKIASKKKANKNEIVSPGHVFPIIAKDGGVLVRAGHTEASVDISKIARKNNSAVICEIMNEDGTMAKGQALLNFAQKHKLKIGKIEDLISYRLKKEKLVKLKKSSEIKVKNQKFKIKIYKN